jgi:MFS family permease
MYDTRAEFSSTERKTMNANAAKDPRELIDHSPMTYGMWLVVAVATLLNAMDGFDILSVALASNGIAKQWAVPIGALSWVLTAELIGMAIGSVLLGGVADRIGRRPTLLGCLVTMAAGMFMATTAGSPNELLIWRVITGLGIGGMLSATNALVAEFTNLKSRKLCISIMVIGYPLGAGIVGLLASPLINNPKYGWHSVFYLGAALTAALLPLAFFCVPESVHWLTRKQPAGALDRVNKSLSKVGLMKVAALPEHAPSERSKSIGDIFSPALRGTTLVVTAAYFFHIFSFYFLAKNLVRLYSAVFAGLPEATSGPFVAPLTNFGGAAGGILVGVLAKRIGFKPLTITIMVLNFVAILAFGRGPADWTVLTTLAIMVGFFGNAAISGLYSIVAYAFPTHVKATGTGFVIGVGRLGALLSTPVSAYLFDPTGKAPLPPVDMLPSVALIMGLGSLLAAVALIFLKLNVDRPVTDDQPQKARELRARTA